MQFEASCCMPASEPYIELLQDEYEKDPFPESIEHRVIEFLNEWQLTPASEDDHEAIVRWLTMVLSMRKDMARWSIAINLVG